MAQVPNENLLLSPTALPLDSVGGAEGRSFWQVVQTTFRRRWSNLISVGYIAVLAMLAVFVPFLANSHPLTMLHQTESGWVREWPLFANLSRLDWSLLVAAGALLKYAVLHRWLAKIPQREDRNAQRLNWLLLLFVATLALIAGLFHQPLLEGWKRVLQEISLGSLAQLYQQWPRTGIMLTVALLGVLAFAALAFLRRGEEHTGEGGWGHNLLAMVKWLGVILLALLIGILLDPGQRLSPYDHEAYRLMQASGEIRSAIFTPIPWSPADQEPLAADRVYEFPSSAHLLGTDGIGRDVVARLLWSTRVVMGIGFIAETIALLIGVTVGAFMGYYSRYFDLFGMRLVEIFESVPTFILILIFVATYGRDIFLIMVILGLTGWTGIARFTRAEFLRLRQLDYVQAAIAAGLPLRRVLFRHMLPNGLTPVIVTVTFGIAGAVMSESGLSFLGVGVEPPTPSWGSMLNEAGNPAETFRWWLAIAPGLMIFLTVFAYNIIGEGARDAIDPRVNKME